MEMPPNRFSTVDCAGQRQRDAADADAGDEPERGDAEAVGAVDEDHARRREAAHARHEPQQVGVVALVGDGGQRDDQLDHEPEQQDREPGEGDVERHGGGDDLPAREDPGEAALMDGEVVGDPDQRRQRRRDRHAQREAADRLAVPDDAAHQQAPADGRPHDRRPDRDGQQGLPDERAEEGALQRLRQAIHSFVVEHRAGMGHQLVAPVGIGRPPLKRHGHRAVVKARQTRDGVGREDVLVGARSLGDALDLDLRARDGPAVGQLLPLPAGNDGGIDLRQPHEDVEEIGAGGGRDLAALRPRRRAQVEGPRGSPQAVEDRLGALGRLLGAIVEIAPLQPSRGVEEGKIGRPRTGQVHRRKRVGVIALGGGAAAEQEEQ